MSNPIAYKNSIAWIIVGSDSSDNPSFVTNLEQSPFYTPASTVPGVGLSNDVIEQNGTMEVTVSPVLQYQYGVNNPTVTVSIPNSVIVTICTNCTLLSPTSFTFPLTSSSTKTSLTLTNSFHPNNNSLFITITNNNITF
jgi:hypothetical protein